MKTSQAGLDFIAEHEGLELTADMQRRHCLMASIWHDPIHPPCYFGVLVVTLKPSGAAGIRLGRPVRANACQPKHPIESHVF
jgi:hypothetical protein